MTIHSKLLTINRTFIQCDNCENRIGACDCEAEALELASELHWVVATKWNGIEYITRHLCQNCYDACEKAGINQTWTISAIEA